MIVRFRLRQYSRTMTDLSETSPTLVIDRLVKEDEGTYSCLAENVAGRVEERLQVMIIMMMMMKMMILTTVILQVIVTDSEEEASERYSPPQSPYQQRLQAQEEEEDPYFEDFATEVPETYSPVHPSYQQTYSQPEEDNGYGPYERYPGTEEPRYPPHLGYQFQFEEDESEDSVVGLGDFEHDVTTKEGMNVNLDCLAIGSIPDDARADWSREDGQQIEPRHKKTETGLRIMSAKRSDEGRYTCTLMRSSGEKIFSLTINLAVEERERQAWTPLPPFDWNRAPVVRQPTLPPR